MRGRRLCVNATDSSGGRRHLSLAEPKRVHRHFHDFADDARTDWNKCGDVRGHENCGARRGNLRDCRFRDAKHFSLHRAGENNF